MPEPDFDGCGIAHSADQMRTYGAACRAAGEAAGYARGRADERERICAAIKAEDDYCVTEGDYMLDSEDCISVARGTWERPDYAALRGEVKPYLTQRQYEAQSPAIQKWYEPVSSEREAGQ